MSKLSDARQFERIFQGLVAENPLGASENPINAYGPCWCKSGKKWKFCHKSRHAQKQLPFGQIRSLITEAEEDWVEGSHFCLHPSASAETCSPKVIGSHTVQRNGGLSAIVEDNHVLSTKKGLLNLERNDGDIVPARIGLKDASTFPGFCNKHDTSMFLPAEGQHATLNKETAFLLSFRALAYEYVMKQYNIASHDVKRDNLDRGVSFAQQVAVQSWIDGLAEGTRMALDDIGRWKAKYDSAYVNQDYSGYRAYFVEFDSVLPFVGAGAFMPEFDFLGNTLQSLGAGAARARRDKRHRARGKLSPRLAGGRNRTMQPTGSWNLSPACRTTRRLQHWQRARSNIWRTCTTAKVGGMVYRPMSGARLMN